MSLKKKINTEFPRYKLLAKVDSMRKIDSGLKSAIFSPFTSSSSLRTRIYYNIDKVVLNFKNQNNSLSEKSSFLNDKSYENQYNTGKHQNEYNKNQETSSLIDKNKMCIERYYMKRNTSQTDPKSGYGRISVGIQLRLPNHDKLYTLIVSNYDYNIASIPNRNIEALNNNKFKNNKKFKNNRDENTYAILTSPQKYQIYYSFPPGQEKKLLFVGQEKNTEAQKDALKGSDLKFFVDTI